MSNAKTSLEEHYPSLLSDAPLHLLKYLKLISGTIVSLSIWLQSCPNTPQSAADQPEKKIIWILAAFSTRLVAINELMYKLKVTGGRRGRPGQPLTLYEELLIYWILQASWSTFKCLLKINQLDIKTKFLTLMNYSFTFSDGLQNLPSSFVPGGLSFRGWDMWSALMTFHKLDFSVMNLQHLYLNFGLYTP